MATREQDVVNRMYEQLNAHDPDGLARFYSEDCEVVVRPVSFAAAAPCGPSHRRTGTRSPT